MQLRGGGVDEADHGHPLVPVQRVTDERQPLVAQLQQKPLRIEPIHHERKLLPHSSRRGYFKFIKIPILHVMIISNQLNSVHVCISLQKLHPYFP